MISHIFLADISKCMNTRPVLFLCAFALVLVPIMAWPTVISDKDKAGVAAPTNLPSASMVAGLNITGPQARSGANECNGRGCYYWENLTVPGTGYKKIKTSNQVTCCNKCFAESRCLYWSWGFRGNRKKECYFFDESDKYTTWTYTQYYNTGYGFCGDQ